MEESNIDKKIIIIGYSSEELAMVLTTMASTGISMEDIEITSGTAPADITIENHAIENIKCEVAALYDQEIAEEFDNTLEGIKAASIKHGNLRRYQPGIIISSYKKRNRLDKSMRGPKFGRKGRVKVSL